MDNRYQCLGLQGITQSPGLKRFVRNNWDYMVSGYGCDYYQFGGDNDMKFVSCIKGSPSGPQESGLDLHFSSYTNWTLWFDSALDTDASSHKYMVRRSPQGKERFPLRVICPDVLSRLQPGDMLEGRVIAFVKQGTIADPDTCAISDIDGEAVQIVGRIRYLQNHTFSFGEFHSSFLEVNVDTELGLITMLALPEALDPDLKIGSRICASAYLSMDMSIRTINSAIPGFASHIHNAYADFPGDDTEKEYLYGFEPSCENAINVLLASREQRDIFRFGRCCADTVLFAEGDTTTVLDRWELIPHLDPILRSADSAEAVPEVVNPNGTLYPGSGSIVMNGGREILVLDTDEYGFVCCITHLSGGQFHGSSHRELHLYHTLARAICHRRLRDLEKVMDANCTYYSDDSGSKGFGIRDIVNRMYTVSTALGLDFQYSYEIVPAHEELIAADLDDLPGIYRGEWCMRLHQGTEKVLSAIAFIRLNQAGQIRNIRLSRNGAYLKAFAKASNTVPVKTNYPRVNDLLEQKYGSQDPISAMRQDDIQVADESGVYVWQKADQFIQKWFRRNDYHPDDTQLLDDCIGYRCTRKGKAYAIYVYAYGTYITAIPSPDACASLRSHPLSQERTILVICLHVTAERNSDGKTDFFVSRYDSKDDPPEVWHLGRIGQKNAFLFFPRQEMIDLENRLMAAFNATRLDILQSLLSKDAYLERLNGTQAVNVGMYGFLYFLREHHGVMKTAFLRFDDRVYNAVPYIDNACYITFSVDRQDRICSIELCPLDESYRELILTDEVITTHPMDQVPALKQAAFLQPNTLSRFSMLLTFDNGETRRYDAPNISGSEEVVSWCDNSFTDKIFQNGRIADHIHREDHILYSRFQNRYQGVEFINGASISTVELYHSSYPVGQFPYRDDADVFSLQGSSSSPPFFVGHIRNMDPADPLYLFDREKRIAKTLPAQYQDTPIVCYPFCGGYSEGLLMVSTMGEVPLAYYHDRSGCAGMWGWLDTDLHTVIAPQYVFALNFQNGKAIVCKGEWCTTEKNGSLQYWCEQEAWGVIDPSGQEIIPCQFDALYEIEGSERLYLVHSGGWENGHSQIYDITEHRIILELDFPFDIVYIFNECFVTDDDILVFLTHLPGKGEDVLYAYDLQEKKYTIYAESYTERTFNGQSKVTVNVDGQEIILF